MPLFSLKKHNLLLSNFYDVNNAENKNKSTKQNRGIFKKPNFVILSQVYINIWLEVIKRQRQIFDLQWGRNGFHISEDRITDFIYVRIGTNFFFEFFYHFFPKKSIPNLNFKWGSGLKSSLVPPSLLIWINPLIPTEDSGSYIIFFSRECTGILLPKWQRNDCKMM